MDNIMCNVFLSSTGPTRVCTAIVCSYKLVTDNYSINKVLPVAKFGKSVSLATRGYEVGETR